jgi:FMN phosphatase YigB (HAD superfamily)
MIFSNNDELHFPYIWDKYSSLHFFQDSDIMISSRLGYIKPDIRIYHAAAVNYKFEWKDSLFVDDKLENIEIAQDLGAKGIWHVQDEKTLTELLKITAIK